MCMENGKTGILRKVKGRDVPENMSFIFLLIHSDDIIIISHDEFTMNEA